MPFYDDLREYVMESLSIYDPIADVGALGPAFRQMTVDWVLKHNRLSMYVFGVLGNDKDKECGHCPIGVQAAVSSTFISLVVHEDMESLGARERLYLTRNADKQYPQLTDFQENAAVDIDRLASVPT